MPELPEVETTRRGIAPHVEGRIVTAVSVRQPRLRRPVPADVAAHLCGHRVEAVRRRAKYLLLDFSHGTLVIHLGMSGSLRFASASETPDVHEHFDLIFADGILRYRDPRRFGLIDWLPGPGSADRALADLGVEPLDPGFDGAWLYHASRARATPTKLFLMDGRRIAGIGNIYASESLFRAAIDPRTPIGKLGPSRCARLAEAIRGTLADAVAAGGSTLRDFTGGDGKPGYFQHEHAVYGREGQPCRRCGATVLRLTMGQRSTFFCARCQRR